MKNIYVRNIVLFITLAIVSGSCEDDRRTMLFLGDSLTSGAGLDEKHAFPALVNQQIPEFRVLNQGRPGETTNGFLKNWENIEDDFPARADIVFIQLGANDLAQNGVAQSSVTNCINNMETILFRLERRFPQAKIVLMSSTKIDWSAVSQNVKDEKYDPEFNGYLSRIAAGYAIIAKNNGYSFVDLNRTVPMGNTLDGAHLSKSGHKVAAKVIMNFLRLLLAEDPLDSPKQN